MEVVESTRKAVEGKSWTLNSDNRCYFSITFPHTGVWDLTFTVEQDHKIIRNLNIQSATAPNNTTDYPLITLLNSNKRTLHAEDQPKTKILRTKEVMSERIMLPSDTQAFCLLPDNNGSVLCSDRGSRRIIRFSPEGYYTGTVEELPPFTYPTAIVIYQNELYTCGGRDKKVEVFDDKFRHLKEISLPDIVFASGFAITSDGKMIVTDCLEDKVIIMDQNYNVIHTFGKHGEGEGEFHFPLYAAVDAQNKIWISDSRNHRVQVFDSSGKLQFILGETKYGNDAEHFDYPCQICFDIEGNAYIADHINDRIKVYSSTGKLVKIVGKEQGFNLREPTAVTVVQDKLLVADARYMNVYPIK